MDELTIEGKLYISSKRAAKVSGYAKDYIGQLCREGRVDSKLVGRSWYVYEPSIREHRFNDERSKAKKKDPPVDEAVAEPEIEENAIEKTWEGPVYTPEAVETLPEIAPQAEKVQEEKASEPKTLSEMQTAWQEWFAGRETTPEAGSKAEYRAPEEVVEEKPVYRAPAEPVAVRTIVSDIAPVRTQREDREPQQAYAAPLRRSVEQIRPRRRAKSSLIAKSALGALIVVCASIALVATGLVEDLHLGGIANSPFLQYFQGSQVIEK